MVWNEEALVLSQPGDGPSRGILHDCGNFSKVRVQLYCWDISVSIRGTRAHEANFNAN